MKSITVVNEFAFSSKYPAYLYGDNRENSALTEEARPSAKRCECMENFK